MQTMLTEREMLKVNVAEYVWMQQTTMLCLCKLLGHAVLLLRP